LGAPIKSRAYADRAQDCPKKSWKNPSIHFYVGPAVAKARKDTLDLKLAVAGKSPPRVNTQKWSHRQGSDRDLCAFDLCADSGIGGL
jgi:hypothetical protein